MVDSLFLSPAFIFVESSFVVVASIAAYELLIGDFIWAQQEDARRKSMQSQRGRGYDSFESRQMQLHGHRSLSPGPGGHGHGMGPRPSSRRASSEESSLLYPPRSRADRDGRVSEEGYYSSPGDTRFASPGRGSSGDRTRRLFYKVIFLALLSRIALLPVETLFFPETNNHDQYLIFSPNATMNATLHQILLRTSQTLPDVIFASALGLLVIFCAQIAFAAMPPLSPQLSGGIHVDDDAETLEDGTDRGGLGSEGAIKGNQESTEKSTGVNILKGSDTTKKWIISAARISRTVLSSAKTFSVWNIIISTSYALVFCAAIAVPIPVRYLWTLIVAIYSFLLVSLCYVASLLGMALYPGIVRRKNVDSLAIRLVGTCLFLAIMLLDRVVRFGMTLHAVEVGSQGGGIGSSYTRSALEYALSESLPVLFILFMMHRKRKELQNDVLVIHSMINNLFGSATRLDTTTTPSEGTGVTRGGSLGSRRYQTYGGMSSSASSSAYKARRSNFPRASSSSGGGRPKQQSSAAADGLAFEGTSHVGATKKGGLMPYVV